MEARECSDHSFAAIPLPISAGCREGVMTGSGRTIDSYRRFLPRFRQNVTWLTVSIDN